MRRFCALFCVIFLLSGVAQAHNSKAESVSVVLKALDEVYSLSGQHETTEADDRFDKQFIPYLHSIRKPYELEELAATCFVLSFPGKAGDDYIDAYLDRCFSLSLIELSNKHGNAARQALRNLKDILPPLDGGAALDYEAAVKHQGGLQ
jgi:hypothetical protein